METDFIVGETKAELERKIAEKEAEEWEAFGEGGVIELENTSDTPKSAHFWRIMFKKD